MLDADARERIDIVLVRPHYAQNVGAAARAMKTMGLFRLVLVRPGKEAGADHEGARKMAVKSLDVLEGSRRCESVAEALADVDIVATTSSHPDGPTAIELRAGAQRLAALAEAGKRVAVLFGNEKSGLSAEDLAVGELQLCIPMVAPQPSINLAQAVQLVSYELFVSGSGTAAR